MDVLVKNLPAEVHAELMRRARASDMSLRAYLREVLSAHVAVPSMDEWLQRVAELAPVDPDGPSGAGLVRESRAENDGLVGR